MPPLPRRGRCGKISYQRMRCNNSQNVANTKNEALNTSGSIKKPLPKI